MSQGPLVSVCLPTYNGAPFVDRAVSSALAQDYEPLEVVVVDDRSTDGTAELVRNRFGDRVRLVVNSKRRGLCGNYNATLRHARGDFIKFLAQDDLMHAGCVSKMVDALVANPSAGLVFSRRAVEVADDVSDPEVWPQRFGELHANFSSLDTLNSGPHLFAEWLARGFAQNWVGEPVAVMVTRQALNRVGLFNRRVVQLVDVDLWMRLIAHSDAVFIDEDLATFRHSDDSSTTRMRRRRDEWLDEMWMLEGLSSYGELVARHPEILELRKSARRTAFRTGVRAVLRINPEHRPVRPWLGYVAYRASRLLHSGRHSLLPSLDA